MKVVMAEPGQYARITELEDTLEAKQKAVGGLIACAYPWEEPVCIVANNEGLLNEMPLNRYVEDHQIIVGPFFVCGITEDDFCSLTDEQAKRYRQMFLRPELFLRHKDGFLRIPYDDPGLPGAPEDLAERIKQQNSFPDLCFAARPSDSGLVMLRYGENGYYPLQPQPGCKSGREYADTLNEQLGVSKAQASAMLYASICGDWHTSLVPDKFDKDGRIKAPANKPKNKEER